MKKFLILIFLYSFFLSSLNAFEANGIESKVLLKTDSSWNGAKIPAQNIANPETTLVKIKIAPKKSLPIHKHQMINVAYVVKGTLLVKTTDGKTITLKAGDTIAECIETWHYGENIGEDDVELLVFYIGEKSTPLSDIKK